jgi:hypothetical protein
VQLADPDVDGKALSSFLLYSVNHYNLLQERLVILCEKSLLRVKFDFIKKKVVHFHRMPLSKLSIITTGVLCHAPNSLAEKLENLTGGGVNLSGRKAIRLELETSTDPSFFGRWNPWSSEVSQMQSTYCSLIPNRTSASEDLPTTNPCSVLGLEEQLKKMFHQDACCEIRYHRIVLDAQTGLPSLLYNQNSLGTNTERNGINF